MPHVYELPTHLQIEDQLIAGLSARQLVRLTIGASLAYGLWDQGTWLPEMVRLPLAAVLAGCGALFALWQPAGRPLDQWLLAAALFLVLPRQLVWRPGALASSELSREPSDWAELAPRPGWIKPGDEHALHSAPVPMGLACSRGRP